MALSVESAIKYLVDGGLGEVMIATSMAAEAGQPKVQSSTEMAMALCVLADEAIKARKANS